MDSDGKYNNFYISNVALAALYAIIYLGSAIKALTKFQNVFDRFQITIIIAYIVGYTSKQIFTSAILFMQ
jgi:hypothetical protein